MEGRWQWEVRDGTEERLGCEENELESDKWRWVDGGGGGGGGGSPVELQPLKTGTIPMFSPAT